MKAITVLMPVYNGAAYLATAIDSILQQEFEDFELLIINDASTDSSEEIICQFQDPRICYFRNEVNIGLVNTLNRGIELCNGKYIARMDQDDWAYPERLRLQFAFLENNPAFTIVGSHIRFMDNEEVLYYPVDNALVKTQLLIKPSFAHPAVMIRKSILVDNDLRYSVAFQHAEDYGLWVQLSAYGKMGNIDEVLLAYRRHPQQYSVEYKKAMHETARRARNYYLSILPTRLTPEETNLFLDVVEGCTDFYTSEQCAAAGKLLRNLHERFVNCKFSEQLLEKTTANLWRKLCVQRQKKNINSYRLFLSNKLSLRSSMRLHAWFIRRMFIMYIYRFKHSACKN